MLGVAVLPRVNGETNTTGTRHPSSASPPTRSVSTSLGAITRGGTTVS